MTTSTITAPAKITIAYADGADTININLPTPITPIPPIDPPVDPPVIVPDPRTQVVRKGDATFIKTRDGHQLAINATGTILLDAIAIPGGGGSSAVGYDSQTNGYYGQDEGTSKWFIYANATWTPTDWLPDGTVPPIIAPPLPPVVIPPGSTPRTQLLAYLNSRIGQCVIGQTSFPDEREFNEVTQQLGISPGAMINDPWVVQYAGTINFDASYMNALLAHAQAGAIAGMSLMFPNPLNGQASTSGGIDLTMAVTAGNAVNAGLNRMIDQVIPLFQQFKNINRACLCRHLFELDGAWFWWGMDPNGPRTTAQQRVLYRYIVQRLRDAGLGNNIVTEFAINGGPGTYEYPGADVVDVVGIDCYNDNLAIYKGQYDRLRGLAPDKPFFLTEYGTGDPNGPDQGFDLRQLEGQIKATLPRTVLANFWSGWQPTKMQNAKAAMTTPFWLDKSEVHV